MNRDRTVRRYLGVLLAVATLVSLLPTLVLPSTANAATTSVTIIKYASDNTTVLAQTTVTYQWMEANLPVLGDGTTHYYHQGPVFIDNADEATEQALRWNPAEDTNVQEKDMGAVKGTNVKDLCNLVGGMSDGDELKVKASDGLTKWFGYKNVYQYSTREGPMGVTWCKDGNYPDTGYSEGMRLVWFADTSVNPWGIHAFGNYDWHQAADPEYWYYYVSGGENYPTTTGLSVQYVSQLLIYSNMAVPTYSITASAGSNGSISPSGSVSASQGGSQTFVIMPEAGYYVADVLVDGASVGAVTSYTFTNVTTNHTISAGFAGLATKPPVAAFTADVTGGAAPLTVRFTDQSTGDPTAWAWDFNNDNVTDSHLQNPSHTYDVAGGYTVKLTVTNASGSDSKLRTDYITVTVPTMALLWGPYITGTTTTATVVNVKTTLATTVTVQYATEAQYTAGGTYNQTATDGLSTLLHHVALTGLAPDAVYHYRVLYGTESTTDCHFRTFPASGPFTCVVLSDTQDQLPTFSQSERFKLVADSIAAQPDVTFVMITGDLVNDGSDLANWNRFFDAGRAMLANTTLYTALGNHELSDALYYEIFGLPAYYSFDCGDAHFTVLDSTKGISAQTTWLGSDLDSSQMWRFVMCHHPLYTSDSNHFGGWANLRSEWEGLFEAHGVDAVWNGHMHAYERYLENGIQYMVMGTGGAPCYQLSADKYDGYQNSLENSLAYAKVTVDSSPETSTVQVIRVADVSLDNAQVTTVYQENTVFEIVVITQAQPDWDLNSDHVCNIGDVVVIGLHWSETGAPGWIPQDINRDGVIDTLDVAIIGLHWGETWQ